jgi:hypothetical protein
MLSQYLDYITSKILGGSGLNTQDYGVTVATLCFNVYASYIRVSYHNPFQFNLWLFFKECVTHLWRLLEKFSGVITRVIYQLLEIACEKFGKNLNFSGASIYTPLKFLTCEKHTQRWSCSFSRQRVWLWLPSGVTNVSKVITDSIMRAMEDYGGSKNHWNVSVSVIIHVVIFQKTVMLEPNMENKARSFHRD